MSENRGCACHIYFFIYGLSALYLQAYLQLIYMVIYTGVSYARESRVYRSRHARPSRPFKTAQNKPCDRAGTAARCPGVWGCVDGARHESRLHNDRKQHIWPQMSYKYPISGSADTTARPGCSISCAGT